MTWNVNDLGDSAPVLETSTERLLYVADRIEHDPESWNQGTWAAASIDPLKVSTMHTCGSVGCIAGHGVASTPWNQLDVSLTDEFERHSFHYAGMVAFDIGDDFARVLFGEYFGLDALQVNNEIDDEEEARRHVDHVANCLRWLASVPTEKRLTLTGADAYYLSDGSLDDQSSLAERGLPPWSAT